MIKKIASLKGQVDCPNCFSLLEWDSIEDIKWVTGNKYIVCPECGNNIILHDGIDYWKEEAAGPYDDSWIVKDGKTRLHISKSDDSGADDLAFCIQFQPSSYSPEEARNTTIDWGDGTVEVCGNPGATNCAHTYAESGDYVITMTVNSGTISFNYSICGSDSSTYGHNLARLTKVEIGDKVTTIGSSVFKDCPLLTDVYVSNGVTTIGEHAFQDCYSLKTVILPDTITSIGYGAFQKCVSLLEIAIPNVTELGGYTFAYCNNLRKVELPKSITEIPAGMFRECHSLMQVAIPSTVESIGVYAFYECDSLKEVSFPSSLTSIGNSAFSECLSLERVSLPSGLTSIPNQAFQKCCSLKIVILPDTLTSIGDSMAFSDCTALTSITIPSSVTSIGYGAFSGSKSIFRYILKSATPPSLGSSVFYGINYKAKIYVPYSDDHSVLDTYKAASGWSAYASKMEELQE